MKLRHLLYGASVLLAVLVLGCSPTGNGRPAAPTPSPEEAARLQQIEALKPSLNALVQQALTGQPWYKGGQTSDDGLRFLQVLAKYFKDNSPTELNTILLRFPEGINAETGEFLERMRIRWPVTSILLSTMAKDGLTTVEMDLMEYALSLSITYPRFAVITRPIETQPWFMDGISPEEAVLFKAALGSELYTWEMPKIFWGNFQAPWFLDGADPEELALVEAAGIVAQNGRREVTNTLLQFLETKRYVAERVDLPQSGPIRLLVVTDGNSLTLQSPQVGRAIDLIRTALPKVEAFAGVYRARIVIVRVVDNLGPNICGQAQRPGETSLDGDITGVVSVDVRCLQERTIVHELAHLFEGTVGPTWYLEGVADLTVLHVARINGSYLSTPASGKIDPELRLQTDNEVYRTQGALGAKLLVDVYRIIGAEAMSSAVQEIAQLGTRRGQLLLETIVRHTPADQRARVVDLIGARVTLASPLRVP